MSTQQVRTAPLSEIQECEAVKRDIARLRKEIDLAQVSAFELEINALKNPISFGNLPLLYDDDPQPLSAAQKEKFCNAVAHEKCDKLLKHLGGIRVIEYEILPERFIVEIKVSSVDGRFAKASYVTVEGTAGGGYSIGPYRLPHVRIMEETKLDYPLGNKTQLTAFLRRLMLCCETFEDRCQQVKQLKADLDPSMFVVFHTSTIELVEVTIIFPDEEDSPWSSKVCKLRLFYRMWHNLPYEYKVIADDADLQADLTARLRTIQSLSLLEAFRICFLKENKECLGQAMPVPATQPRKASRKTAKEFRFSDSSDEGEQNPIAKKAKLVGKKRSIVEGRDNRTRPSKIAKKSNRPQEIDSELSDTDVSVTTLPSTEQPTQDKRRKRPGHSASDLSDALTVKRAKKQTSPTVNTLSDASHSRTSGSFRPCKVGTAKDSDVSTSISHVDAI